MEASPSVTTPGPTAQWLAKLLAVGGFIMIAATVALNITGHLSPELAHHLLGVAAGLVSGAAALYGALTTFLKFVARAKDYEPEAEAVAALIPGPVGTDIRLVLGFAEKAINLLALAQPIDPAAVAKVAGAAAGAQATTSAGPGSPSAA